MALTPTWESTDLPILEAAIILLESGRPGMPIQLDELLPAVEFDEDIVARSLQKLSHEHLEIQRIDYSAGTSGFIIRGVTPKGLRAAGVWPSENAAAGAFLKALDEQIEEAPEGSSKHNALKTIRDSAGRITEGTLTALFSAAVKAGTGL
ncbi:hypothetical protein [Nesterenkonia rhizosphaerae]|uniref:DUF2513 domain-containing protein n=1 Tax=Nesterenkonia rhizosphaerae TaxID=1348272 RepID=A0ABP9G0D6_9MICC